jgi:hypothetical protein
MIQSNIPKLQPNRFHQDERGSLFAINEIPLAFETKRLYLIEPTPGFWRGKHYHKLSNQMICVVSGRIECKTFNYFDSNNKAEFEMSQGNVYLQLPGITFTFNAITDKTKIIVLSDTLHDPNDYFEVKIL